ncbi:hypothetical protein [Bartonella sp. AC158YNML]|uniref:hypothetical protein n=1 Tax=Bartonella sp. AC158YNML TaxID=3243450 RepID=UPI0035CFA6E3
MAKRFCFQTMEWDVIDLLENRLQFIAAGTLSFDISCGFVLAMKIIRLCQISQGPINQFILYNLCL